ncbi:MAG TPA: class I SAM-dependent methyltransferase [Rectinemataceae bacterium]|nr:class I SAM-dependent methyltransferase [Rectinemataceae bacterium]
MNETELFESLEKEYKVDFSGWDFSHIEESERNVSTPLTWNYRNEIAPYLKSASTLLDLGTGGGEFLDSLDCLPAKTFATEGYALNLPIARARLAHRGIEVRSIEEDKIPFIDGFFDVVIDRHESYRETEVERVLVPGGYFITQQVGGLNDADLLLWMGAPPSEYASWSLGSAMARLERAGFSIIRRKECVGVSRFFDVGALVYYLKCVPWMVPDFSLEKYRDEILRVAGVIEEEGYIDFIRHRFLIVAGC